MMNTYIFQNALIFFLKQKYKKKCQKKGTKLGVLLPSDLSQLDIKVARESVKSPRNSSRSRRKTAKNIGKTIDIGAQEVLHTIHIQYCGSDPIKSPKYIQDDSQKMFEFSEQQYFRQELHASRIDIVCMQYIKKMKLFKIQKRYSTIYAVQILQG